jgi:hypothetical protein
MIRLEQIRFRYLVMMVVAVAMVGCHDDDMIVESEPDSPTPILVQLIPPADSCSLGDTAVAEVFVEQAENVGSIAFRLRYDASVLQFVPPAIEGPFMSADGADVVTLAVEAATGGELVVGISRLGDGAGAAGQGLLITFEFVAIGVGRSSFEFNQASVRDPRAQSLPAVFDAADLRVLPLRTASAASDGHEGLEPG